MHYARTYIEITNVCNRNCSFCPGTSRTGRRMTMEEFRYIVENLKSITKYLYFHVMGEPLLHPLLGEFIKYAKAEGFLVSITTNGTLLSRYGESLLQAQPYKMNLSIHSFEEGEEADYISYMKQCIEFADAASKKGILTVFRLWNRGYDAGRNIDTLQLMKEYFREDWVEGKRGFRIRDKLHLEYGERFAWPDQEAEDGGSEVFCYGLKDHFGILCDGSVIPCCLDREGTITLGNIFEQKIEEILTCDRAQNLVKGFRNRKATEELCRKCGYARRF